MARISQSNENGYYGDWQPIIGRETKELLASKGFINDKGLLNESGKRIQDETYRIMQLCGDPKKSTNNESGIVIGYVQSGKTLSFTTLTALARDNDYQMVIIIAGVSTNLVNQSTNRLTDDLRLNTRHDKKWTLLKNCQRKEDFDTIETCLAQWADPTFPSHKRRTLLITVMKQASHLLNLITLLQGLELGNVPALIIDDEGDQASLNTKARAASRNGISPNNLTESQVSTIYNRITTLRSVFPNHTFLQYTATPQANLFINIMDRLSPNFIRLLTPGEEYTGGTDFFRSNSNLIIEIPVNEISTSDHPLIEIPESLKSALRIFFLGVVAGELNCDQKNRTMLVHPSRLQGDHSDFMHWINNIRGSWERILSGKDDEVKKDLLKEFKVSYQELKQTVPNLQAFEVLSGVDLIHVIKYTLPVEVNSRNGQTPQIPWNDSYAWILVGGQSVDRGFTVEGLTVTYMPRNIGTGNVDTIQQRARFFGYKKKYLGFCRVYLDQVTIDAYNSIIEHEEDVRKRLLEFDLDNKHLDNWDREAVLNQMLNLTRSNVIYDSLQRDTFGNDWFRINAPHDSESLIEENRQFLFSFLESNTSLFFPDQGHQRRTEDQKHMVATTTIKNCLENLLNKLRFTRESDSTSYSSLRGILKSYIQENENENCRIYLMSTQSINNWNGRTRRLVNDKVQQLFQGRNPKIGELIYPGDADIKINNLLTIQIHLLNLRDTDLTRVPTLAVWIPEHIGKDIIKNQ